MIKDLAITPTSTVSLGRAATNGKSQFLANSFGMRRSANSLCNPFRMRSYKKG